MRIGVVDGDVAVFHSESRVFDGHFVGLVIGFRMKVRKRCSNQYEVSLVPFLSAKDRGATTLFYGILSDCMKRHGGTLYLFP